MKQLLPFKVSYESYAIELTDAQEVVENARIDPFPGAPEVVAGAISFHGRIVPVVDMAKLLDFPLGEIGQRLIVLVNDWGPMALGVDQVGAIVSLDPAEYKPVQNYAERKYICDVVNWGGSMIGLLDLEQVRQDLAQLCYSAEGGR